MKSPLLNILTIILGGMLIISGLLKYLDMFSSISFYAMGILIRIPNNMSFFYILIVNFIGGGAMCFHAASSYRFKKGVVDKFESDLSKDSQTAVPPSNLSKLSMTAAILSLIISLWLGIRTIVLLTGFEDADTAFVPFAVIVFIITAPFCIVPLLLVGKNLTLSSRLGQLVDNQQKAELRAKAAATRRTRR